MKECRKCGARNPDSANACQSCGSTDLEYIRIVSEDQNSRARLGNALPVEQQYIPQMPYQTPFQVYDSHKAQYYSRLGGFLKFIVYGNYITGVLSIIGGIITLIQYIKLANIVSGFGNTAGLLTFLGIVVLAVYAVLGVICIIFAKKISNKDYDFLRFIQIVFTVSFVLSIIILFADRVMASRNYYYTSSTASSIFYLVFGIICFIIWNLYFTTSERVYYYMGSATYIKRSIYTSGVRRWDALEVSREMMEDSSSVSKLFSANPTNPQSQMSAFPVQPAPSAQAAPAKSGLSIEDMEALKKLKELLDMGAISEEEYNNLRSQYISKDSGNTDNTSSSTESTDATKTGQLDSLQSKESDGVAEETTENNQPWKCNSCSTINPSDSKTCKYCGGIKLIVGYVSVSEEEAPQPAKPAQELQTPPTPQQIDPDVKFCGKCGSRLEPGARFCVSCGNQITY